MYLCKLHIKYHVQLHIQHFFSEQVTTLQINWTMFFQKRFEIPLYMFISIIKTTSTHGCNF